MSFQFFQSVGWIVLCAIGVVWFVAAWKAKAPTVPNSKWNLVLSCSIVAFLFGALIAVKSSGGVPIVITGWGANTLVCQGNVDTSRLASFRDKYKLALACGINDPMTEKLDDVRITVSSAFEIIPGGVRIVGPLSPKMATYMGELQKNDKEAQVPVWFEAIIVPTGINPSEIKTLRDVYKFNGKIIREQYYK